MKKALLVIVALTLVTVSAWAGNNATCNPLTTTYSFLNNAAYTNSYNLTITSPNPNSNAPLYDALTGPGGLTTTLAIAVTDAPNGVADATALGYVYLTDTSDVSISTLTYTAISQGQTIHVHVNVPTGAVAGSYVYSISTTATGSGWGVCYNTLTLDISAPQVTDTTPPTVTFTSPDDNSTFAFCSSGTPVGFAFNAVDNDSVITAVSADVNGTDITPLSVTGLNTNNVSASGSYSATAIGAYTINAHATSSGGTGDASDHFAVTYSLSWLPPLSLGKTSKGGSTVPIKFTVRDCNGNFIHDESVQVAVVETSANGSPQVLSGVFGDGASSVLIDFVAGQYIINFQTAAGSHTYQVQVFFQDFLGNPDQQGSYNFSVR